MTVKSNNLPCAAAIFLSIASLYFIQKHHTAFYANDLQHIHKRQELTAS